MPLPRLLGYENLGHVLANDVAAVVAKRFLRRMVEFNDSAILIQEHDAVHGCFEHSPFAGFALAKLDLRTLTLGNVPKQALNPNRVALGVEDGRLDHLDVHLAATGLGMDFDTLERLL